MLSIVTKESHVEIERKNIFLYKCTRDIIGAQIMNDILANSSQTRTNNIRSSRPSESIETAGSLAMNQFHSLFETKVYDMFSSSNPFAVDYTQYADCGDTVAYNGGFLVGFSSAVSTLSSEGAFSSSDGGSFSGGDCGFSSASSCCSSGSFSSVC